MKDKKSKTVIRTCKHHGETEFYSYASGDICKECRKSKKRKKYHEDPKERERALRYTRGWNKRNPEKIKEYQENEKERKERQKLLNYNACYPDAMRLADELDMDITGSMIYKWFSAEDMEDIAQKKVRNRIILRKRTQIRSIHQLRLVAKYTYEYRDIIPKEKWDPVQRRPRYSDMPRWVKDKVNKESREFASKKVKELVKGAI